MTLIHRATLALSLALLALGSAPSCSSPPAAEWEKADVEPVSMGVLWEVTRHALAREGFPVAALGFDPSTREVVSGWRMDLHPFRGEGYRERAVIAYQPRPGGRLDLSVRVQRQINDNIARPLDPAHAEWKDAPDEPARARVLLQSIRALLGDSRRIQDDRIGN